MKRIVFGLLLASLVVAMPMQMKAKKKKANRKTAQTEKYAALSALERKYVGKHMLLVGIMEVQKMLNYF